MRMLDFDNSVKTEQDLGPRPTMSLAPETPCRMRPISFEDRETPPPLPYQMQAESWGAVLPLWDSGGCGFDARRFLHVFKELLFPPLLDSSGGVASSRHRPRQGPRSSARDGRRSKQRFQMCKTVRL